MRLRAVHLILLPSLLLGACAAGPEAVGEYPEYSDDYETYSDEYAEDPDGAGDSAAPGLITQPALSITPPPGATVADIPLIQPGDITYLGAFRLPDDFDYERGWYYGGSALAFFPEGDPGGGTDGFPGSLFGTGHDWNQYIAEVTIPAPVISASHDLADLPIGEFIQPFTDVRSQAFPETTYWELPRAGLAYLPAQAGQDGGKLYFAWGQHYQEEGPYTTHGWISTDLTDLALAGPWYIGGISPYALNDYIFDIPAVWAQQYAPGLLLATGRYRDGGWGGQGPSLYAFGPWLSGSPPEKDAQLPALGLIQYGTSLEESPLTLEDYHHSDEWAGGAWLTLGDAQAVIFAGTKGVGEYWYGFGNGVVWPDEEPFPEIPAPPYDVRGWWSDSFVAQLIFYDPADLAAVALGMLAPHEPQPYAVLDLDRYLFSLTDPQQKYRISAVAYDRANNLLYIAEPLADEDKPIIHVFRIGG
ncbi:MAG: hypothetical protein HYZ26_02435 [Chloroflexi bacterium]|nr:hypothetical protein [Chloroflexota bacterium]